MKPGIYEELTIDEMVDLLEADNCLPGAKFCHAVARRLRLLDRVIDSLIDEQDPETALSIRQLEEVEAARQLAEEAKK